MKQVKEWCSLFLAFFQIGLFTIGGGIAMIPLIQRVVVEDRHWLTEEDMMDCITVSQSMPGVIAINTATYVGNRRQGLAGAIAATLGVILPSFLIIIIVVQCLGMAGENRFVTGAFRGIKAAVCGMILVTCFRLGRTSVRTALDWLIWIAAFCLIVFLKVTAVWVILAGALLGVFLSLGQQRKRKGKDQEK